MKWFLLIAVIALGILLFTREQALREESQALEKAQVQIADLQRQLEKMKKQNPFAGPLSPPANVKQGARNFGGTALDHGKDSGLDRPRK